MANHIYRPLLRPASFATLPKGLEWDFIEAPASDPGIAARRGLPLSRHPFGIIATARPLSKQELEDFDLAEGVL